MSGNIRRNRLTGSATVFSLIFRVVQYCDVSQSRSDFAPLLQLQEWQHRATFTSIIDLSLYLALSKCSHVALRLLSPLAERSVNFTRQYTQSRSLIRTSASSSFGIPQLFMNDGFPIATIEFSLIASSCFVTGLRYLKQKGYPSIRDFL